MAKSKEMSKSKETDLLEALSEAISHDINKKPELDSSIKTWCSSRSLVVDSVLAAGRKSPCSLVPFGRQVEISGEQHVGKSTLCAQIIAEAQQQLGALAVVTDVEDRIDKDYWIKLGVSFDPDQYMSVGSTERPVRVLEDIFNAHYKLLKIIDKSNIKRPIVFVTDSFGAASLKDLFEEEGPDADPMEVAQKAMGKKAKKISAGIELVNPLIARNNVCYIYTNHVYSTLGQKYGSPTETGGGERLKYMATVRLSLSKGSAITDGSGNEEDRKKGLKIVNEIGKHVYVRALKNSMGPVLATRTAVVMGNEGFSNDYTVMEIGYRNKLLRTSGAWSYWVTSVGEEIKFQGYSGFKEKVVTHPEYKTLVDQVVAFLNE